jgi:hypothetical protein
MLGLLKVIVVMAVIALVGGFAVHWAKDQASSAIHRAVDTSLPAKVSAHPWAPLSHGHRVTSARVRFAEGSVTTARCHTTLGTYSVQVDHTFSFHRATTPPGAGCPGRRLAAALGHATRVDVSTKDDVDTLTFTHKKQHTVATLRGPHSG